MDPAARSNSFSDRATSFYESAQLQVISIKDEVIRIWTKTDSAVSNYVKSSTSQEVHDVFMKFFRAIPETLITVGLIIGEEPALIASICWAARTVISALPLFKAIATMDQAAISKGAQEAWKNLVEQHKNFVPALTVICVLATLNSLHLLSLKRLAETALLAVLSTALLSTMFESQKLECETCKKKPVAAAPALAAVDVEGAGPEGVPAATGHVAAVSASTSIVTGAIPAPA